MDWKERVNLLSGQAEQDLDVRKLQAAREQDEAGREMDARRRIRVQLDAVAGTRGLLPTINALSQHEKRRYSLAQLLKNSLTGEKGGVEREVSAGIAEDLKTAPKGIWFPLRLNPQMTGLDTKTNAAGNYLTGERLGDIIDYLQHASKLLTLGSQLISGLRFAPAFPTEVSPTAASWVSENSGSNVSEVTPTFGMRTVSAHSLQATWTLSRQLLQQSSESLEAWARRKIAESHALALDKAGIHGSGLIGEPIGLLATSDINVLSLGANGAAASAANLIELERLAGDGDAAYSGFLTNSLQRSKLRTVPEISGGTTPVWRDSALLGHRVEVSDQVSSTLEKGSSADCSGILYSSDWSKLLLLEWNGALDVVIDPYGSKKKGCVEITSFGMYDCLVQQSGRFSAIKDAR